MDEIADLMESSGSLSNPLGSNKRINRSSQYKMKTVLDQQSRRAKLLKLQKQKRKDVVNQLRRADDLDWCVFNHNLCSLDDDDDDGELVNTQQGLSKHIPSSHNLYKDQLMLSEWMVELPEDLEENWIMTLCPVGKRCLVVAKGGNTYMYTKSGYMINRFPSKLPGGCYNRRNSLKQPGSGISILDCIYNEINKTFYVIDIMCWNGHPVIDSDTEFRFFWLRNKLEEYPDVASSCKINPFMFHSVPYFRCTSIDLNTAMQTADCTVKIDGLLFYHKQAHYLCGSTPLVLWIKPYMVPEVLGIEVHERYLQDTPPSYPGFKEHVDIVQTNTETTRKHQDLYVPKQSGKCKPQTSRKATEKMQVAENQDAL